MDDGDVILTFAHSHVVALALQEAARLKSFRVLVVDARPELEGRLMLQKLLQAGVACSYVHINAMSYAIREVTKVCVCVCVWWVGSPVWEGGRGDG